MSTSISNAFGLLEAIMDNMDQPFYPAKGKTIVPMGINVSETKTAVIVRYELPGVNKKDIDLEFERGYATLTVEKVIPNVEGESIVMQEFPMKETISRKLKVVVPVDFSKAKATYESGILTLHLPKMEQAIPSKLEIE